MGQKYEIQHKLSADAVYFFSQIQCTTATRFVVLLSFVMMFIK